MVLTPKPSMERTAFSSAVTAYPLVELVDTVSSWAIWYAVSGDVMVWKGTVEAVDVPPVVLLATRPQVLVEVVSTPDMVNVKLVSTVALTRTPSTGATFTSAESIMLLDPSSSRIVTVYTSDVPLVCPDVTGAGFMTLFPDVPMVMVTAVDDDNVPVNGQFISWSDEALDPGRLTVGVPHVTAPPAHVM